MLRLAGLSGITLLALLLAGRPADAAVEVHASVSRTVVAVGESVTLDVTIEGGSGTVGEPRFDLPEGIVVLGSQRSQNVSWINGRMASAVNHRYELGVDRAGRFAIGPIQVRIGGRTYESPGVVLSVGAGRAQISGSGQGRASLVVQVTPPEPYVGQPVLLRVRLVQRAQLAEDPRYEPPPTPGFWSERSSQPESYLADEARAQVLVTETRTRLYPLAAGTAQVGSARAVLRLALPPGRQDPFAWMGRSVPGREVAVQSAPVGVRVRPLPPGAPPGYDGAVGRLDATWSADRRSVARDAAFSVRLDVRGIGDLPLLRTPAFSIGEADVFAGTVQDSLGAPGTLEPGRRRFQWTVLAQRPGTLKLMAPAFSWFDPEADSYRVASLPPVTVEIGPAAFAPRDSGGTLPAVFARHPVDPFARPARAWGLAVAGLLLGIGLRAVRRPRRGRRGPARAGLVPNWLEGIRHAHGPSFWTAAERGCAALEARGEGLGELRQRVSAARFGGASPPEDPVREALLARLGRSEGDRPRGGLLRAAGAVGVLVAAFTIGIWSGPHGGGVPAAQRMLAADRLARSGDVDGAAKTWRGLWQDGSRQAGLAARLAWAEIRRGAVAEATLWVVRGDRGERRDPSLLWVTGQVHDAGGLVGFAPGRLPVRSLEWAMAACMAALLVAWLGRRMWAVAIAAAILLASADGVQRELAGRNVRGVVRTAALLQGAGVELLPGQVVRVLERGAGRVRVEAGRQAAGWLPDAAVSVEGGS